MDNQWKKGCIDGVTMVMDGVMKGVQHKIDVDGDCMISLSHLVGVLERAKAKAIQALEQVDEVFIWQ